MMETIVMIMQTEGNKANLFVYDADSCDEIYSKSTVIISSATI